MRNGLRGSPITVNGAHVFINDDGSVASPQRGVFIMGGGGSGKGAITASYKASLGVESAIDSDEIKKEMSTYSNKVRDDGTGGPSGPKSIAEFQSKYPQDVQDQVNKFVGENTQYKDAADFADHHNISGGMTHELSSFIAKARLQQAIASGKSFIYDSTGSKDYEKWANQTLAQGMGVTIHHVETPRAVALMRNDERDRTVPRSQLLGTHDKAALVSPIMREYAAASQRDGLNVEFAHSKGYKQADVDRAASLGYTDTSGPDI